jgi:hypothetical protein
LFFTWALLDRSVEDPCSPREVTKSVPWPNDQAAAVSKRALVCPIDPVCVTLSEIGVRCGAVATLRCRKPLSVWLRLNPESGFRCAWVYGHCVGGVWSTAP